MLLFCEGFLGNRKYTGTGTPKPAEAIVLSSFWWGRAGRRYMHQYIFTRWFPFSLGPCEWLPKIERSFFD